MDSIKEISHIISKMNFEEIQMFISEILTESELSVLSKRWCILKMLLQGNTQRQIAKELNVSLCKVTRGSKIVKNQNSVTHKYLIKEKLNVTNK